MHHNRKLPYQRPDGQSLIVEPEDILILSPEIPAPLQGAFLADKHYQKSNASLSGNNDTAEEETGVSEIHEKKDS